MSHKIVILGAGLAGISSSYHIGHDKCIIYEKNAYPGGHIYSYQKDGFTWDEGPHVSFTKNSYVKELFEKNTSGKFLDYAVKTTNYYEGNWIPHPAQSNLWAIPQPLRQNCLDNFIETRNTKSNITPKNYQEWLEAAFGITFANNFPKRYTEKYWTVSPQMLSIDWVGERVFYPDVDQVKKGFHAPLKEQTHYIKTIRYPENGGYFSFAKPLYEGADIRLNKEVREIRLRNKEIKFADGSTHTYEKLINTLPLPSFIQMCKEATPEVIEASKTLSCSSLLLVNVVVDHPTAREENWIYVYDEEKYSTRINCTELLSPNNAPKGKSGIQVEVYFSKYKLKQESDEIIAFKVCKELIEMGLIRDQKSIETFHTHWVPWANVIFDESRREAQNEILEFLTNFGLKREDDDLVPVTDWENKEKVQLSDINLAGRYGQWKYYWTDDCVLRGKIMNI